MTMRPIPLLWLMIPAAALALAGLFFRTGSGPEAIPFFYPLLAVLATTVLVVAIAVIKPLLERKRDFYDAD